MPDANAAQWVSYFREFGSAFNYAPLTTPPTPAQVKEFKKTSTPNRFSASNLGINLSFIAVMVASILFVFALVSYSTTLAIAVGTFVILPTLTFMAVRQMRQNTAAAYQVNQFAQQNGLTFHPAFSDPYYPIPLFQEGSEHEATGTFTVAGEANVTFMNYKFVTYTQTKNGRQRSEHTRGLTIFDLPRHVPEIALLSKTFLMTEGAYTADQKMALGPEVDKAFRCYVPAGSQQDALYVLAPDVLAALLDTAAGRDIHLVGNQVIIVSNTPHAWHKQTTWQTQVALISQFGTQLVEQVSRYTTTRTDANAVTTSPAAAQGLPGAATPRLKVRGNPVAIIVGIAIVVAAVFSFFGETIFATFIN
jgi:hypothetical protein